MQNKNLLGLILGLVVVGGVTGTVMVLNEENVQTPEQNDPGIATPNERPQEQGNARTGSNVNTNTNVSQTESFKGIGVYVTVHIEPVFTLEDTVEHWEANTGLVERADLHDMKLSLHFSPQMAEYVLDDSERLALVRSWETNGHEIGFHHHGLSHREWDGYSNEASAQLKRGYKGTMDDLMAIVSQLPASGNILVGSGTDEATDWPEGVKFAATGGEPPRPEDILSEPEEQTYNGTSVIEVTKAPFAVDFVSSSITMDGVASALASVQVDECVGLTLSDRTLGNHLDEIENLFELIETYSVHTRPIADILETY